MATAWTRHLGVASCVGVSTALVVVHVARGALSSLHRSRLEGVLFRDALASTLAGNALSGDEVALQQVVIEGVEAEARARAEVLASLAGEAVAAVLAIAWAALTWSRALSFSLILSLAIAFPVALFVQHFAARASAVAWRAYEELLRRSSEVLLGRVELVSGAGEAAALARIDSVIANRRLHARRSSLALALAGRAPMGLATLSALGASVVLEPQATVHASVLVASALPPFAGLALGWMALTNLRAARARLRALLASPAPGPIGKSAPRTFSRISFQGVGCRYDTLEPALGSVSFAWKCDVPLVLSGANGSGKSTLLRLLVGLVFADAGEILIDAEPLSALAMTPWRRRLAYLPQRPYLPAQATVREAIRFLAPEATDEAIFKALERVELLDTLVAKRAVDPLGVGADDLSSGERQRVAIARVLVRVADVYLLDEPDQNLDRRGVRMVSRIVGELSAHAAVAIAAHDAELLAVDGQHVVLARGALVSDALSGALPEGRPK